MFGEDSDGDATSQYWYLTFDQSTENENLPEKPKPKDPSDPVDPTDPEEPQPPIITPSKSGETIIATARGTYWQSIDIDRLNKRMGDRRMAEDGDNGLWVRVCHDRIGTNAAQANFRAKNTAYQTGYEHIWNVESGKRLEGIRR